MNVHVPSAQRRDVLVAVVAFLLGLAVTYAVVRAQQRSVYAETQARFEGAVQRLEYDVQRRMNLASYGLRGMAAAYAATGELTPSQFRKHVDARDLSAEFPGVIGFGLVQRVPRVALPEFEQAMLQIVPGFHVATSGSADDLYVVKFIAPDASNHAASGFDLGQEVVRREAIERAISTGALAMSGRIPLIQDQQRRAGWLMLLPLFRPGADLSTFDGRRQNLLGLLYAPILAAEVLADVKRTFESQVDFRLFDGPAQQGLLLFDTEDNPGQELVMQASAVYADRAIQTTRVIEIGGHQLTLQLASTPEMEATSNADGPKIAATMGMGMSLVLGLFVWQLVSGRKRAETIAQAMTADLRRMAKVIEHTSNAVFGVGTNGRVRWINPGFTRVTGYSEEEAVDKRVDELLAQSGGEAPPAATPQGGAPTGEGVRAEKLYRRKDGSDLWIASELLPERNEQGEVIGWIEIALDVTERRRAGEQLRASQAFLEQAEQIAGLGGWEVDLETQAVKLSRQTLRLYELAEDSRPSIQQFIDQFDRAGRERIAEATARAIKDGAPWDLELRLSTVKGRTRWVRTVGRVERRAGRSVRLIGTLQDISERRAMEDELRDQNARFQVILENLPCALSVFDAELRLVMFNTEFRRALDLPSGLFEAPGGLPTLEQIVRVSAARGEYGADVEGSVARILERARTLSETRFEMRRLNGRQFEVRRTSMPGGGMVSTHVDITERKRAEEKLAASEDLMRLVTDNIPGRVGYWDRDLRSVFVNRAYSETFRKSREEIIGHTMQEVLGAEMAEATLVYVQGALRGEAQNFEREEAAADGSVRTMLVHLVPDCRGADVQGFFVLALDITELKKAREEARQASAAKGQFLANTSHEIRTPMNAVIGMLTLLHKTQLTPRQLDYATKAEVAARSLLALLNDILDFSKVEAGKLLLDPRVFSLDALLRDLSTILAANVASERIEVLFDVDPAIPARLIGDDLRLRQVLINLSGNALKFTKSGEVVLQARLVETSSELAMVEFSVRDTGIGITADQQQRIFEGFSQAEASTVRTYGGTGLGLAISQRMVRLMGGELRVESIPGEGSRFWFTMPFRLPGLESGAVMCDEQKELAPLRALFVDDNPTARKVLAAQARSLGWVADTAASGHEGVALLKKAAGEFDAIFVDWRMAGLDGLATSRLMRQLPTAGKRPLVIMVSARGSAQFAECSDEEQANLDGYLVKPVTASMLLQAVQEARGTFARHEHALPTAAGLSGVRLLLVEDNRINQQIACELLRAQGASVDVCSDGRQGVAAVMEADPPYDAVLMDIQMPLMDGFAATRAIREDPRFRDLPLIAMTANAMPGDQWNCLAAGMNAHVAKPFDLAELVGVIRSCIDRTRIATAFTPANAPAVSVSPEAEVDLAGAVGRLGGDLDFYRSIYPTFRADAQSMIDQLAALLAEGKRTDASRVLHSLKGLSGTIGATRLSKVAADAEFAVTATAAGPADDRWVDQLRIAHSSACDALDEALAAKSTA